MFIDAGNGIPEVIILDPAGHKSTVLVKLRQIKDNHWRCEYISNIIGLHSVNVFFAGTPILNSPFGVKIAPGNAGRFSTVTHSFHHPTTNRITKTKKRRINKLLFFEYAQFVIRVGCVSKGEAFSRRAFVTVTMQLSTFTRRVLVLEHLKSKSVRTIQTHIHCSTPSSDSFFNILIPFFRHGKHYYLCYSYCIIHKMD